MSKAIWASHAMPVDRAFDSSEGMRNRARVDLDATLQLSGDMVRDIHPTDPEPVKFLKRCLTIALAEEDYGTPRPAASPRWNARLPPPARR